MKTIFDNAVRSELINRVNSLDEHCQANWGKMNVYQMAKHCTIWNDWLFGRYNTIYKQELLGKIFGKIALKNSTKDDRPMLKNMPTGKAFTVKGQGDVEQEKRIWARQIDEYENYSNPAFIHDFFGKMTYEQIGILAYKHFDHHLRQFGV